MKDLTLSRYTVAVSAAAALLAGCGGSQPPIGAPGAMSQTSALAMHADRVGSWMLPEAKRDDLLYIADYRANAVYVYSYPKGKPVGTLSGIEGPGAECVDKNGNVWVMNQGGTILEYAHGGTSPVKSLSDASQYQAACSVDPVTGDFAVANSYSSSGSGEILIFKNASGTPKHYTTRDLKYYWSAGYDTKGNLFVDGTRQNDYFNLVELAKGAKALKGIALTSHGGPSPAGVQWVGTYLAVGFGTQGGNGHSVIWQLKISKYSGTLLGKTKLDPPASIGSFFIQDATLIAAEGADVYFFKYPTGGYPTMRISGFELPLGAVVSVALSR